MKPQVICLPGGVAPAAQRYGPLRAAVGDDADLYMKDLEVYREAKPSSGYSVEVELEAIDTFAAEHNLERFHLLGYSGGGFLSLAYAGTRRERIRSLALFEPASIPGPLTHEESAGFDALVQRLKGLEGPAFMAAFVREQLKPGVEPPPPPASTSPEMAKRPAGIAALIQAFNDYRFDRSQLETSSFPVFLGYGDLTSDAESVRAAVLAHLFADIHVRRFAGVHHFVAPEQIYTLEHVRLLLNLWRRGEASATQLPL
ncbi:MAG: alpha/beta hydrolase [Chloroflexi bacterium]|nr:MAG: alpha/beta hydrolase [Chloroflexota bacterium]